MSECVCCCCCCWFCFAIFTLHVSQRVNVSLILFYTYENVYKYAKDFGKDDSNEKDSINVNAEVK